MSYSQYHNEQCHILETVQNIIPEYLCSVRNPMLSFLHRVLPECQIRLKSVFILITHIVGQFSQFWLFRIQTGQPGDIKTPAAGHRY